MLIDVGIGDLTKSLRNASLSELVKLVSSKVSFAFSLSDASWHCLNICYFLFHRDHWPEAELHQPLLSGECPLATY